MGFLLKHTHRVYRGDEMANNQSLVCYLHTLQGFFPLFFFKFSFFLTVYLSRFLRMFSFLMKQKTFNVAVTKGKALLNY